MVAHCNNNTALRNFRDKHLALLVKYIRGHKLSADEVAAVARTIDERRERAGMLYVATSPRWNFVKVGMTSGTCEKLWLRYVTLGGSQLAIKTFDSTDVRRDEPELLRRLQYCNIELELFETDKLDEILKAAKDVTSVSD